MTTKDTVLADEYVLTHRNDFPGVQKQHPWHGKSEYRTWGQFQSEKACTFCKGRGHWKTECPKANARRGKGGREPIKFGGVGLCLRILPPPFVVPVCCLPLSSAILGSSSVGADVTSLDSCLKAMCHWWEVIVYR